MVSGVVRSGASVTSVRPRRAAQHLHAASSSVAELGRVVRALALGADERALDVHADHAGYARRDGLTHRGDRVGDHREIVADQRGQEAGGAEAAVRGADGADRLHGGRVVEQHAAAAVHLRVDESGQQQRPAQVVGLGGLRARIACGHDRRDAPVVDEDGACLDEPVVDEDAAVEKAWAISGSA